MVSQVSKTLLFWNSAAITLLLKNTTVKNTTSGYHPVCLYKIWVRMRRQIVISPQKRHSIGTNCYFFSKKIVPPNSLNIQHFVFVKCWNLSELWSNHFFKKIIICPVRMTFMGVKWQSEFSCYFDSDLVERNCLVILTHIFRRQTNCLIILPLIVLRHIVEMMVSKILTMSKARTHAYLPCEPLL